MGWVGQGQHHFWWRILLCKIQPQIPPKKRIVPARAWRKGGLGGNSATPERIQKTDSPAVLLVKSRTPHKSFLFLLEEKNRRAQNEKSKEYFSAVWRACRAVVGLASLLGVLFKKCSNFVQKTPPSFTFSEIERCRKTPNCIRRTP